MRAQNRGGGGGRAQRRRYAAGGLVGRGGVGVLIRCRGANSAIPHLDRSSGRHEMSVDLVPPLLTRFSFYEFFLFFFCCCEQRQMAGVIQSDQTPETP